MRYSRDMRGHGEIAPDPAWPGGARIAVQIVVNYEEGGENSVEHGDAASEAFLSEIVGAQPWPGQRHWNMESIYDYGARAGFWRLHRLLKDVPLTVYGVATALERSPEQVAAMQAAGWEIATHGLKWIDYRNHSPEAERADIEEAKNGGVGIDRLVVTDQATINTAVVLRLWAELFTAKKITANEINTQEISAALAEIQTVKAESIQSGFLNASLGIGTTGAIMAASVVVTIPVVVLVLIFQRRIVAGLTSGAVKG